jgi:hypothetical protein
MALSAEPDFATLVQRYFAPQKHAAMATRRRDRRIGSKKRPARRADASRPLGPGGPLSDPVAILRDLEEIRTGYPPTGR